MLHRDNLDVELDSPLATMAQLNRAACIRYADALLSELEGVLATCTNDDATASSVAMFEQIHALKNLVIPTGCQRLLAACTDLHASAAWSRHRVEVNADFMELAQATRDLISAFRRALDDGASS